MPPNFNKLLAAKRRERGRAGGGRASPFELFLGRRRASGRFAFPLPTINVINDHEDVLRMAWHALWVLSALFHSEGR